MKLNIDGLHGVTPYGAIGEITALTLELNAGSITSIFQGKEASMLFRLLCGQGEIKSGKVTLGNSSLTDCIDVQASRREWLNLLGLAFRDRGLLANQTIFENIALPWKYHAQYVSNCDDPEKVLIEGHIPEKYWHDRPHDVPWNIRKWALLARSIVLSPRLLMLDDPTVLLPFEDFCNLKKWIEKQADKGTIVLMGTDNTPFGLAVSHNVIDLNSSALYTVEEAPLLGAIKELGKDMNQYLRENK